MSGGDNRADLTIYMAKKSSVQKQVQTQTQALSLSPQQVIFARLLELSAAEVEDRVRSEIIDNPAIEVVASDETGYFDADQPITGAEAAVMIQNALDLTISQTALETVAAEGSGNAIPAWAAASVTVMNENGVALTADKALTRGELAKTLYRVSYLSEDAPGMTVIRKQR